MRQICANIISIANKKPLKFSAFCFFNIRSPKPDVEGSSPSAPVS